MLRHIALAVLAFQAAAVSKVAGHGNLIVPMPTGSTIGDYKYYFGGPAGVLKMREIIGDADYNDWCSAADQWFTDNGIATLKDYITTYGAEFGECGHTMKDGEPQPVPSDGFAQHDTLGESHRGPCEIWCDDARVFHSPNCLDEFAGQKPAMIPIDVATCQASSEMTFYWLALHEDPWQVYINCVALDGTVQGPTIISVSNSSTTTSEVQTPSLSSTETAPAIPAEQTDAPVTILGAPTSSKCKVKRS